jgi:hypothetical protein
MRSRNHSDIKRKYPKYGHTQAQFGRLLGISRQRVHQWAQQDRLVMLGCPVDYRESCRRLEETQMPTAHEISRKGFRAGWGCRA